MVDYINPQTRTQEVLPSTMSIAVHNGQTDSVSANHCGEGQGGVVYALVPTVAKSPSPTLLEEVTSLVNPLSPQDTATTTTTATVIIKGNPKTYPVTDTTTVAELIHMISEGESNVQPVQIRLLFSGRILQNNDVIQQLPGYQAGVSTLLSVFRPATTGGTRKHRKRHHKTRHSFLQKNYDAKASQREKANRFRKTRNKKIHLEKK